VDFQGRTICIAGASRAIGYALFEAFARRGAAAAIFPTGWDRLGSPSWRPTCLIPRVRATQPVGSASQAWPLCWSSVDRVAGSGGGPLLDV